MFWSETPKYITRLHPKDEQAIEAVAEALTQLFDRVADLEAEVAALKKEPRQSLKAKLREKGIT